MPPRNQRLEYLLSPVQQRRLRKLRLRFEAALDETPRDQQLLNKLRAQMPPGGPSWPLWTLVLSAERTEQEVTTTAQPSDAAIQPVSSSQEAA